jgi:hypothetical protein
VTVRRFPRQFVDWWLTLGFGKPWASARQRWFKTTSAADERRSTQTRNLLSSAFTRVDQRLVISSQYWFVSGVAAITTVIGVRLLFA